MGLWQVSNSMIQGFWCLYLIPSKMAELVWIPLNLTSHHWWSNYHTLSHQHPMISPSLFHHNPSLSLYYPIIISLSHQYSKLCHFTLCLSLLHRSPSTPHHPSCGSSSATSVARGTCAAGGPRSPGSRRRRSRSPRRSEGCWSNPATNRRPGGNPGDPKKKGFRKTVTPWNAILEQTYILDLLTFQVSMELDSFGQVSRGNLVMMKEVFEHEGFMRLNWQNAGSFWGCKILDIFFGGSRFCWAFPDRGTNSEVAISPYFGDTSSLMATWCHMVDRAVLIPVEVPTHVLHLDSCLLVVGPGRWLVSPKKPKFLWGFSLP